MNEKLVFKRRWARWWLAPIVLIGYALYGRGLVNSLMTSDPGVRIIIPSYLLLGWLVLAVAANMRRSIITPDGVRVSNMPFPCWPGPRISRQDIWTVYARMLTRVVSIEGSRVTETTYWAGVDTANGGRIDLSGPFNTFERARKDAEQIAGMLNRHPDGRRFDVENSSHASREDHSSGAKVLAWLAAFFVALAAGIYWEFRG